MGAALGPGHDVRGRSPHPQPLSQSSGEPLGRGFVALGFGAFVLFGVVLVLLGSNQDAIARDLALDLARTGLLGASLSVGIGLGVLVAGPLVDRFPRRPLFLFSALLCAASLLAVDPDMGFGRAVAHVVAMGLGGGLYDTLLNAVTVERKGEAAASTLSLLHAGATVGAVMAPPAIGWIARDLGWVASFRATGALYLALALWIAAVTLPPPRGARGASAPPGWGALLAPLLALAVVAFAYVGVEAAVTLFAVPYASQALELAADRGRTGISAFWLGLLVGRLALWRYTGPADGRLLAAMGVLGGAVLAGGVVVSLPAVELWLGAVGLCLGGVFPLMVALAGARAPHSPGTAAGLVLAVGSIGGFVLPWITGVLGDSAGIPLAFAALAFWCLVIGFAATASSRV